MTRSEIDMIHDLASCQDDLEGFEADFVASMEAKSDDAELSDKQADKLEQIWRKHCRDDD